MVNNFITIDLEEWYNANYKEVDFEQYKNQPTMLRQEVDELLELFDKYDVKAIFFVLGEVASKYPEIIRKIANKGHEIASHGMNHDLVYNMNSEEFAVDVRKSKELLENVTQEPVSGFRAPSWSVNNKNLDWYYQVLSDEGYKYSSSIYTGKTFLYGIEDYNDVIKSDDKTGIVEFPVNTIELFGGKYGFSGGFYLRVWPRWIIKKMIEIKNQQGKSVFLYLHPREINPNNPKLSLSPKNHIIHYWGINRSKDKFEYLINNFRGSFVKMGEFATRIK